jgi:site-specific DNA-methyltransferase (adenine-specific)
MDLPINQIIHGDCLEVMPLLPDKSIDMILCDLPFGTTACKWDSIIPFEPLWGQYERIIKDNGAIVLNASQPFTSELIHSNLKLYKYNWIWKKTRPTGFLHSKNMPLKDYEDICVFSKGIIQHANLTEKRMNYYPQGLRACNKKVKRTSKGFEGSMERKSQTNEYVATLENFPRMVLEIPNEGKTIHPTQKPVELCEYLIKTYTQPREIVLDNCIGSGTTAIAALNTGRVFIGIEKEEKYVEIAKKRVSNLQQKLFIV